MREAPKYFRWDFTPREMERLALAERRPKRRWGGRRTKEEEYDGERGLGKKGGGGGSRWKERVARRAFRAVDTSTRARHAWLVREAPIIQLDG